MTGKLCPVYVETIAKTAHASAAGKCARTIVLSPIFLPLLTLQTNAVCFSVSIQMTHNCTLLYLNNDAVTNLQHYLFDVHTWFSQDGLVFNPENQTRCSCQLHNTLEHRLCRWPMFKLAALTYRCLHCTAPLYLSAQLTHVSDIPSRRRLHSTCPPDVARHCVVLLTNTVKLLVWQ